MMAHNFDQWFPLRTLSVSDFPNGGSCCAVYAFRDSRTHEILKFGETNHLRRRMFANFIGGVGGNNSEATTQRIHRKLFLEGMIEYVELAWIAVPDKASARLMEQQFRQAYKAAHGQRWPEWDRQD